MAILASDEPGYEGTAEFFIGPGNRSPGKLRDARQVFNDGPLVELALIAAEYGKTTLVDLHGGAVIFGGTSESEVELF